MGRLLLMRAEDRRKDFRTKVEDVVKRRCSDRVDAVVRLFCEMKAWPNPNAKFELTPEAVRRETDNNMATSLETNAVQFLSNGRRHLYPRLNAEAFCHAFRLWVAREAASAASSEPSTAWLEAKLAAELEGDALMPQSRLEVEPVKSILYAGNEYWCIGGTGTGGTPPGCLNDAFFRNAAAGAQAAVVDRAIELEMARGEGAAEGDIAPVEQEQAAVFVVTAEERMQEAREEATNSIEEKAPAQQGALGMARRH